MKVEHITHGGSSVTIDTIKINLSTLDKFKAFQMYNESKVISLDILPFDIKVTSTNEGAIFDIMKNESIAFSCVCCFDLEQKKGLNSLIKDFVSKVSSQKIINKIISDRFIYVIPVIPFVMNIEELKLAGEIEFYIYYSLYLKQNNKQKSI